MADAIGNARTGVVLSAFRKKDAAGGRIGAFAARHVLICNTLSTTATLIPLPVDNDAVP